MNQTLLIRNISCLVTCNDSDRILRDVSMLVRNGVICAICEDEMLPSLLLKYGVVPLLTSFTKGEKKRAKTWEKLKRLFEMSDEAADQFMACFEKFSPVSIRNEYYTDLLTWLDDDIHVEHTKVHFIYAKKMGEKYLKRYKKYFRDPEIREFDMQHEQWLLGDEKYTAPVLEAIDEFMATPV